MIRSPEDRADTIREALDAATLTIERQEARLAAAPRWYRTGTDVRTLRPQEQGHATRLDSTHHALVTTTRARDRLEHELRAIEAGAVSSGDAERRTVAWLNGATTSRDLIRGFRPDPVRTAATGREASLSARTADVIMRFRSAQPRRQFTSAAILRRLGSQLYGDLLNSGWWHDRPAGDWGVLLPLFIQTRFRSRKRSLRRATIRYWTLQLMITPDRPFFVDHDPLPSEAEVTALDRMWAACDGDVSSGAGRTAFSWLTDAVGGGRAAWLCREYPPERAPGGTWRTRRSMTSRRRTTGDPVARSRVSGLPSELEVWMARGGKAAQPVAALHVDRAALEPIGARPREWLTKFSAARDVGLATEIPLGPRADDIDVIYVLGLGVENPADLFEGHLQAGDLCMLTPGSSTNSVPDHASPDLSHDAEHWWHLAIGAGSPSAGQLSTALAGDPCRISAMPGDADDHQSLQRALVEAVWPGLWGTTAKRLFGFDVDAVEQTRRWAVEHLRPEGPMPAIRIGTQPYGVLPVSHWQQWRPAEFDPPIEAQLLPSWRSLLAYAAERSRQEGPGNSDTHPTELVRRLARTATSGQYGVRDMHPLGLAGFLAAIFELPHAAPPEAAAAWQGAPANLLGLAAPQPLITAPAMYPLSVPLVQSSRPADLPFDAQIRILAERTESLALDPEYMEIRPRELLFQLLFYSALVVEADVVYESRGRPVPPEPMVRSEVETPSILEEAAADYAWLPTGNTPARLIDGRHRGAMAALANYGPDEVERVFRSVLDTAMYRVDPFLTGVAWRRIQDAHDGGAEPRLGAYGWIENPRPGKPGPTEGGLVAAPSDTQLATAVIARSAAVRDPETWHMQLDSTTVGTAMNLATQVETGLHISEAVGSRVEASCGPAAVTALRDRFPLGDGVVVDGTKILEESPDVLSGLGVTDDTLALIDHLRDALDAYADLALLDGVHNIVRGQDGAAGMAMEAVAGFAGPPSLDVVRTPSPGRRIATTVFLVAPHRSVAEGAGPAATAEPTLGSLLAHLPDTDAQWIVGNERLSLSDLGLTIEDLGAIGADELQRVLLHGTAEASVDPNSPGLEIHRQVDAWMRAMACDPAADEKMAGIDSVATTQDLWLRLAALQTAATELAGRLDGSGASPDRRLLAEVATWGIRSSPTAGATGTDQLSDARAELLARVDAASALAPDAALDDLADSVRRLAVGTAPLPILSTATSRLWTMVFDHRTTPAVMDDWLPVNAVGRPRLAAIDSLLCGTLVEEPPSGYEAWTSVDDPWTVPEESSEVAVAIGPWDAPGSASGRIAVGVLDGWTDKIPDVNRFGHAAFEFQAPTARPPQAVLITAPPVAGSRLSTRTLVNTLADTRALIAARAVDPTHVSATTNYLPTAVLPERHFDIRKRI